ncbi:MAG: amino acid permease, partial [Endozoicomonadaceae bacterium]|nr:amino acid permease [Endozoicomonadaceae bacterium]
IPKAIIIGGILIAFFYVVSTVGVLIAVPVAKLSTSTGILESLSTILGHGNIANYFIFFCGILVLFTLIANLVSWAVGINYVATYAAENNDFPKIFAKKTAEHKLPVGVFFINGIVSTILISLYYFFLVFGFSGDLFWNIFSINAIIFLMSYVMLFPAFYTLRKKNPDKNHPFKVKGGKVKIWLIGYVPAFLLMAVLVLFFYVPGVPFNYPYFYRVGGMLLLTAIVGEIVIWKVHRNKN